MLKTVSLYLPTLLIVLMGFSLSTWMDYENADMVLTKAIAENQLLVANEVSRTIGQGVESAQRAGNALGELPSVIDSLKATAAPQPQPQVDERFHKLLQKLTNESSIEQISIFDKNGGPLTNSGAASFDVTHLPYYVAARHGHSSSGTIIAPHTDLPAFYYAMPVIEDHQFLGGVCVIIALDEMIKKVLKHIDPSWDFRIRIINKDGLIIACTCNVKHDALNINETPARGVLQAPPQTLVTFVEDGMQRLGISMPVPDTELSVAISVNKDAVFAQSGQLRIKTFVVNTISAAILLLFVIGSLHRLLRTIQNLEKEKHAAILQANSALEIKIAERTRELDAERSLLRTVLDAIPDIVFYKSPQGILLSVNRAFTAIMNTPCEDVLDRPDAEVFSRWPHGYAACLEGDRRATEEKGTVRLEEQATLPSGKTVLMEIAKTPCFDSKGELIGILGICRDITEQKCLEQEILSAREQALAASEAKTVFLSTITHEIRTPMNAILGFVHLFDRANLSETQMRQLKKIQLSCNTLLSIINDVLDISKIEAGKLELEQAPFNLRQLLDAVCSIAGFAASEKGIDLVVRTDADVPDVLIGDSKRISQVLLNLLNNAVKFTREGHVELCIAMNTTGEPSASAVDAGAFTLDVSVSDTGIGMTSEQTRRLFKPFMQADSSITRRFGGTGLGLSITKQLVELMGGGDQRHLGTGHGFYFFCKTPPSSRCSSGGKTTRPHAQTERRCSASQRSRLLGVHAR